MYIRSLHDEYPLGANVRSTFFTGGQTSETVFFHMRHYVLFGVKRMYNRLKTTLFPDVVRIKCNSPHQHI